jgi:hypothetical protein
MPELADQPPKRERSLLGFYIAVGVVAALVGLGTLLFKPLRTQYAIYRVRHATYDRESVPDQ